MRTWLPTDGAPPPGAGALQAALLLGGAIALLFLLRARQQRAHRDRKRAMIASLGGGAEPGAHVRAKYGVVAPPGPSPDEPEEEPPEFTFTPDRVEMDAEGYAPSFAPGEHEEMRTFFKRFGFVVVRDALSAAAVAATAEDARVPGCAAGGRPSATRDSGPLATRALRY